MSFKDRLVSTFWLKISTKLLIRVRLFQDSTFLAIATSSFCWVSVRPTSE